MPISVAAYPRSETHEGSKRKRLVRILLGQRLAEIVHDLRHDFPEYGTDAQAPLYLVDHRRRPGANEVRLPNLGNLRAKFALQFRSFTR